MKDIFKIILLILIPASTICAGTFLKYKYGNKLRSRFKKQKNNSIIR